MNLKSLSKLVTVIISFLFTNLFISDLVYGQKVWDGGANTTKWQDANNWDPNVAPGYNEAVIFNSNAYVTIGASIVYLSKLTIASGANVILAADNISGANNCRVILANSDMALDIQGQLTLQGSTNTSLTIEFANGHNNAKINGILKVSPTGKGATYDTRNSNTIVNGTIINDGGTIISGTNNLYFGAGSTYQHEIDGKSIPTATWHVTSTCLITKITATMPQGQTQTFGNFIWNSDMQSNNVEFGADVNIAGDLIVLNTHGSDLRITDVNSPSRTINIAGNYRQTEKASFVVTSGRNDATLNIGGNLYIEGGSFKLNDDVGKATVNLLGDFNISAGKLLLSYVSGGSGAMNVAGNFTHLSGATIESQSDNGTIIFNGTGIQKYTSGGSISGKVNFTVNSGATLQMADVNTVVKGDGYFRLLTDATLGITSLQGIASSDMIGNIQVTGQRIYDARANYIYNGNGIQLSGNALTSAHNLKIDNSAGVLLEQPVSVSGDLTLLNGELTTTSTKLLTLIDGATTTGASNASFVNGPIMKVGNERFRFPVGKNNKYMPIEIAAPKHETDAYTAEYFPLSTYCQESITSPGLKKVSSCEYWNLERTNGSPNVDVTLFWNNNDCNGRGFFSDLSEIVIAHFDGNEWNNHGGYSINILDGGSVAWENLPEYGILTFGSTLLNQPLPVHFSKVKASDGPLGIEVAFTNVTESDVAYYEVERSVDGQIFSAVKRVMPEKNDYGSASYSWIDAHCPEGKLAYRVKAVETTGKITYSNVVRSSSNIINNGMNVFAQKGQVKVQINNLPAGKYQFRIFSAAGQLLKAESINHPGGSFSQTNPLNSANFGVYIISLNGTVQINKRFVLK